MKYNNATYRQAMQALDRRRQSAEQTAAVHRREVQQASPEAAAVLDALAGTGSRCTRAFLSGKNVREQMEQLRRENLALQAQLRAILAGLHLPEDYLAPQYTCPHCKDTGYIDGKMCECLKTELRRVMYEELNRQAPLALSTFESFSLGYYSPKSGEDGQPSPRAVMERNLAYCKQYAGNFGPHSPSVLFQGGTGLGKTHLSLAIANEVLQSGHGVVYGTAQNLATLLENDRFSDGDSDTEQNLLTCDLLILDDLGTEFQNSFVTSAFYNIINTRLLTGKPTLISTNLSLKELEAKYGSRIVSRMIGAYDIRPFYGSDVRQILRREKMNLRKTEI